MKSIIHLFLAVLCLFVVQHTALAQLSEDFEGTFPPTGWAIFDNGVQQNQSWEQQTNGSNSYAYIEFSSSTTVLAEDWLVTPKLLPDAMNNTLTFDATDEFDDVFGSVYTVRVSTTSQTDRSSFTEEASYTEADFTAGVFQPFSVDLSAYAGQEIYVAFVLENTRGDSWLLDNVSGPPLATVTTVPNCDAALTTPAPNALGDVPVDVTLAWSPATGDPTGYKIQIGTTQGGSEFLALTDIGAGTTYKPASDFAFGTRYYVTIVPYNAQGDATNCPEFDFVTETDPDVTLDCNGTNISENRILCYENGETEEFTITANAGSQAKIVFNSGTVENNQDELFIYDGTDDTGTLLNASKLYGNAGNFTGLTYVSTTGSLFVRLTPDGSNDCAGGDQATIDFTASCESCVPPSIASVTEFCDIFNGEFFVRVDISSLGNGTITATNDQNGNTQIISTTGTTDIGPFEFGTVTVTLENSDTDCNVELPAITVSGCPPNNDECSTEISLAASTDQNCNNSITGTTVNATASTESGICSEEGLDVWYSFTPASTDSYVFELSNVLGLMSVAIYEGTCAGGLTLLNEECVNEGSATVELTASTTYLVQVFADDEFTTGTFDLCVFPLPAAPANDLCANATVIACESSPLMNQDATFATDTDAATCNNDPIGKGLWYQIEGTGELLSITATPDEWDAEVQLWSGADCNSLTCESRADDGITGEAESIIDFQTTDGTTYYIYIGAFASGASAGLFDLEVSLTCGLQPANIICLDMPVNDPCNDISVENGAIAQTVTACETIVTSGAVTVESGATAAFEAGISITLTTGFTAESGSTFTASIVSCASANEEPAVENRSEEAQPKQTGLQLDIQPNPSYDDMLVQINLPKAARIHLVVTDISGQTVRTVQQDGNTGLNQFNLQRQNLADGMYFLTVNTATERKTVKVIFAR